MEQESRRKATYIYVGVASAVRVFQQKSWQSRKIQGSTLCRKEQQSRKRKKEAFWDGEMGRREEERGRDRRGGGAVLAPQSFPCPQGIPFASNVVSLTEAKELAELYPHPNPWKSVTVPLYGKKDLADARKLMVSWREVILDYLGGPQGIRGTS